MLPRGSSSNLVFKASRKQPLHVSKLTTPSSRTFGSSKKPKEQDHHDHTPPKHGKKSSTLCGSCCCKLPLWVKWILVIGIVLIFGIGELTDAFYSIVELKIIDPSMNQTTVIVWGIIVAALPGVFSLIQEGLILMAHFGKKMDMTKECLIKDLVDAIPVSSHKHHSEIGGCCENPCCRTFFKPILKFLHLIITLVGAVLRGALSFFGLKLVIEFGISGSDLFEPSPWLVLPAMLGIARMLGSFFVHGTHMHDAMHSHEDDADDTQHTDIAQPLDTSGCSSESCTNCCMDCCAKHCSASCSKFCTRCCKKCDTLIVLTYVTTILSHSMEFFFAIYSSAHGLSNYLSEQTIEKIVDGAAIASFIMALQDAILEAHHVDKDNRSRLWRQFGLLDIYWKFVAFMFLILGAIAHILPAFTGWVAFFFDVIDYRAQPTVLIISGIITGIDTLPCVALQATYVLEFIHNCKNRNKKPHNI